MDLGGIVGVSGEEDDVLVEERLRSSGEIAGIDVELVVVLVDISNVGELKTSMNQRGVNGTTCTAYHNSFCI